MVLREADTLFLACTRPAMFMGIPMQAYGVLIIGCGEIFVISGMFSHSVWRLVWCALITAGTYGTCRFLTAIDHNIFGILFLWITTKGRTSRNAMFWGGSSCSPAPLRPARRPKEIPYLA